MLAGKFRGPPSGFGRGGVRPKRPAPQPRRGRQRLPPRPRPQQPKQRKQKRAKPNGSSGGAIPQPLAFEYAHFDPKCVFRGPGTTKSTWTDSFTADGEITVAPFAGNGTQTDHYHTLRAERHITTIAGVDHYSTASYNPTVVMASSQNSIAIVAQPHVMVAHRFLQQDTGRFFGLKDDSVVYFKDGNTRAPFEYHLTSGYVCDPTYDGSYGIYTPKEEPVAPRDPALVTKYAPTVPLRVLNKPFPTYLTDIDRQVSDQGGKYRNPCAFRFTGAKLTVTVTQNPFNAEGMVYGGCCRSKQYEKPEIFSDDHNMVDSAATSSRAVDVPIFDSSTPNNSASVDLAQIGRYAAEKTYEAVWIPNNETAGAWHGSFASLIAHDTQLITDFPANTGGANVGDGVGPLSIACFPVSRTRGTMTSGPNVPTCQIVISGLATQGAKIAYGITYGVEFVFMAVSTAANMMLNAKLANDYLIRMNKYAMCRSAGYLGQCAADAMSKNPALAKVKLACAGGREVRLLPPLNTPNLNDFGRGAM